MDSGGNANTVPATRFLYAVNLFKGFDENSVSDPAYRANIAYLGAGIVRLHHAGIMQSSQSTPEGLLDPAQHTWDRAKIKRLFANLNRLSPRPEFLLNIPSWPEWMDKDHDGFLDRDEFGHYAALLADLVRLVNRENHAGVRYWEITNEQDGRYFTDFYQNGGYGPLKKVGVPDRWDELIALYNQCARAMKQADPTIQTGGPAAARSDLHTMHERFLRGTLPNLDFFSTHAYASGSASDSDESVFDKAALVGQFLREIKEIAHRLHPGQELRVMLGEFNISWTWETRDLRMVSAKGGVFDALVLVQAAEAGAFSAQAWNEKDNIYGKTDGNNQRRPGAEVLHLFNTYLVGNRAAVSSSDTQTVVPYAVVATNKRRSLLLINRSSAAQTVALTESGLSSARYHIHQVSDRGLTETTEATPTKTPVWSLPPFSVTVLVEDSPLPPSRR